MIRKKFCRFSNKVQAARDKETKHKAQETKHKVQETKHKAQEAKHKVQEAKYKKQSTRHIAYRIMSCLGSRREKHERISADL